MKQIVLTFAILLSGWGILQAQEFDKSLSVQTLEGEEAKLEDYVKDGKVTLISFWATWCAPCKKELAHLNAHYEEWAEKYDLEIIAISTDLPQRLEKVISTAKDNEWKFPVLADPENKMYAALEFQSVPQVFLVDKEGNIVLKRAGYKEEHNASLEAAIKAAAQ